jgi:hypothetical protein
MDAAAIMDRASAIMALPGFDAPQLWLTFYLCADAAKLDEAARLLASLEATNLGGADGGFLYPKLPVPREPTAIVARVEQVLRLAFEVSIDVVGVDLDTNADLELSKSKVLLSFYEHDPQHFDKTVLRLRQ